MNRKTLLFALLAAPLLAACDSQDSKSMSQGAPQMAPQAETTPPPPPAPVDSAPPPSSTAPGMPPAPGMAPAPDTEPPAK